MSAVLIVDNLLKDNFLISCYQII